jgi:two-component system NarL family response regulator
MDDNGRIRILVADDHFVVRIGLAAVIDSQPDMTVVDQAENGQEAVDLYRKHVPDVLVVDLRMPVLSGLEATSAIRREFPDAHIVVLTTFDGDEDIFRALQAGAGAYLLKHTLKDELIAAIKAVHQGKRHIPAGVAMRLAERPPLSDLTDRELEVLNLMARGMPNSEIATNLSISVGTVKTHINRILSKLGARDRTQAVTTAIQRGLVHPGR